MPLLEVLIIYLSAGAPFGVLVLFSRKSSPQPLAVLYALLATLTWPIFGTYRLCRGISRKRERHVRFDPSSQPLEALEIISRELPTTTAELFEIAGHSNPWVATNCYARARKKVIASHIERLSKTPEPYTAPPMTVPGETMATSQIVVTART
jgi:hypothetical protein